jgi:hypothetical protein
MCELPKAMENARARFGIRVIDDLPCFCYWLAAREMVGLTVPAPDLTSVDDRESGTDGDRYCSAEADRELRHEQEATHVGQGRACVPS